MSYKTKAITDCTDCPCFTYDSNDGASCNLEYNTNLLLIRKSDNILFDDIPQMENSQGDFELKHLSLNCGLVEIITNKKVLRPKTLETNF